MRKKIKGKLNNSGSTLVVVLVMVAFMTVLGTVAVTSAMVGYKMKLVDKEVKRTFYSAEEVVDEIYAGLGMKTMNILQEAYMGVISSVTVTDTFEGDSYKRQVSNSEANRMLREKFTEDLIYALTQTKWASKDSVSSIPGKDKFLDLINTEFIENPELAKAVSVDNISVDKTTVSGREVYTLRFKNCTVEYRTNNEADASDTQTYFSRVTFDGVLDLDRYVNFSSDINNGLREFEKFSLVGCLGVDLSEGAQVNSSAGIYAGVGSEAPSNNELTGGLVIKPSALLTVGGNSSLISKGRIFLESSALKVTNSNLWCVDLITTGTGSNVDISGNAFVSDDTEINGDENKVAISGNYYGYSKDGFSVADNTNSSAIIVNGNDTLLNLQGINTLMLAGRAYIDYSSVGSSENDYLTGQSLALKGNQEVYLLPENYMTEPGTEQQVVGGKVVDVVVTKQAYNPVAANKKIVFKTSATGAETTVYSPSNSVNTVTILVNENNFFGFNYLNSVNPFRVVTIGTRNYIYLNFKSADDVKKYYDAIYSTDTQGRSKEWIASRDYMKTLLKNNVNELNQSAILNKSDKNMTLLTNGSLINATPANEDSLTAEVGNTASAGEDQLAINAMDFQWRYKLAYRTLLTLPLVKNGARYYLTSFPQQVVVDEYLANVESAEAPDTTPFNYYVNESKMISYCGGSANSHQTKNGTTVLYVCTDVNDTYTIPAGFTEGIILTKGNVVVNHSFSGLVMANGKITVTGTASLDNQMTSVLLDRNKDIRDCFKAYSQESAAGGASESEAETAPSMLNLKYDELITFENWRKQSPTTTSNVLPTESASETESSN